MNSPRRLALAFALLGPVSCSSEAEGHHAGDPAGGPAPVAQRDLNAPQAAAVAAAVPATGVAETAPAAAGRFVQPVEGLHVLHNVFRVGDRIISGDAPEDPAAFDELASLGVKTIISVDGSMPHVAEAKAKGMRYVHIPITYATVTPAQQLEIAKAVRDLPGPVFVHCHHGKHRGPAAAASAAVLLDMASPEQAVAYMKEAGTAANYAGLYACVAAAKPAAAAALDALPSDFPSLAKPVGLVGAMVSVDVAFEHLGDIRAAGWSAPKNNPDLSPASEAGQLADSLRFGGQSDEARDLGDGFGEKLAAAIAHAADLEAKLVSGAPSAELEASYKSLQASCKDCHAEYRDSVR